MTAANIRIDHLGIDHLGIARSFASEPCEWHVAPRFSPTKRWHSQLADHADYQVWLVTWLPGQGVELHQHSGPGALYVVRGELAEELVEPSDTGAPLITTRPLPPGSGLDFTGPHQHRIINRSARPSVSVHVHEPSGAGPKSP